MGRAAEQADLQALRAAVLLDEMDFPGFGVPGVRACCCPGLLQGRSYSGGTVGCCMLKKLGRCADPRQGHIVVEVKTGNTLPLLEFSCSKRIMALPSGQMNARRFVVFMRSAGRLQCRFLGFCLSLFL